MVPKVSVIVPVYNVERYLQQCLDSILNQTLEDIEVLCIDDGSTDTSGELLDNYARRDNRVRVFHQRNKGYGAAMNAGLDAAAGEYIGIVESDDCIKPEMYETLYLEAFRDGLDVVKADAYYWIEDAGYVGRIHYKYMDDYYGRVLGDEYRNKFFDFYMNIWTGIYKREFLAEYDIRFHESPGAAYQDNGFWMQTLCYCRSAKWLNEAFYLYRQDNPAASIKSRDKMMAMTEEFDYLGRVFLERGDYGFLPYCYYYKLYRDKGNFIRIADEHKREFCEQIKHDYASYKSAVKYNSYLDAWLRGAAEKPDELCARVIEKKSEVLNRLEKAAGIIVYGAGNRGNIIFRSLYNEGYYRKLLCFAVSKEPQEELIGGRQVLTIRDAHERYPDALIIVAVIRGSGMYRQMAERLAELGIDDFMDGSDIEENFYII